MKIFLKYFWIVFINIILILYLSELLVTIFLAPAVNMQLGLDYLRYEKAKEIGVNFDIRTDQQAFFEEKKNIPTLSPRYRYNKYLLKYDQINQFIDTKLKKKQLIPLRGPINKKTLSCNEDGKRKIVNNDKNGFKNPNFIYKKQIKIFLIGDSFAEGACLDENNDVAGILRNKFNTNTANYGIGGSGPLSSLAVLKEYGIYLKPSLVFYFYYEGNDMEDLSYEKKTFLKYYLEDFTQNLFNRNEEIDFFLIEYEKVALDILKKELENNVNKFDQNLEARIEKIKDREKIEIVKDFFELKSLKRLLSVRSFFGGKNYIDENLFTEVLKKMSLETSKWNGKLIFVYIPAWNRYYQKYSAVKFIHKRKIINITNSLKIDYIDIPSEFEKYENPINLYNFGLFGHFNREGYGIVAEKIFNNIAK